MTSSYTPPMYGNWREPRSAGIGKLGFAATGVAFAGLAVAALCMMFGGLKLAAIVVATVGVFLALTAIRDTDGLTAVQKVGRRARFRRAKAAGANLYRSGPLGRTQWGRAALPGLLARSVLTEHEDAFGHRFAMLEYPSTGHFAIVVSCAPNGQSGVDPTTVDDWIANWGGFLGTLGLEPDVVAAAVTVETAPDPGVQFQREIHNRLAVDASPFARRVMEELAGENGAGSAATRAWVTLTFSRSGGTSRRRRDAETMGRELGARMPHFVRALAATGAGGVSAATAQDLCELVRVAYDPAAARLIEEAASVGQRVPLTWDQVGPLAHEAGWDRYVHDSGVSVTWSMTAPPRGAVYGTVLRHLLSPSAGVTRKRVTLLYRPLSAAAAASAVEADLRNATNLARQTRSTVRAGAEHDAARQTAREEAQGAGLLDFGLLVTATLEHGAEMSLEEMRQTITNSSTPSRVVLRPAYGAQDAAFAATLPLGLHLPAHITSPRAFEAVAR